MDPRCDSVVVLSQAMGRIQPLHYLARTAPSSLAEMDDYLEVMASLVMKGASLNHQTDFGETVLHCECLLAIYYF